MEAEKVKAKEEEEEEEEKRSEMRQEPGASRHGNFINYYQFHKVEERVRQLPLGVWKRPEPTSDADRKYIGLDVGCNVGDLTRELRKFLQKELPNLEILLYGVDLDPILIERARELQKGEKSGTEFQCMDVMSEDSAKHLESHLERLHQGRRRFDAIFCFSVTMWIHLNHGDEGLRVFLRKLCDLCEDLILIEPQPWKCYRSASRRLRRAGAGNFPLLGELELKGDVSGHLERMLRANGFQKVVVTEANDWNRKLLIYRRRENFSGDEAG